MAIPAESPPRAAPVSFEQCYEAHRDEVYRLGLRYGGNRAAFAEDLTHDVFLQLLQRGPCLDQIANLGAYLHTVTANLAISRLRSERSLRARLGRWWNSDPSPGVDEHTPQRIAESHQDAATATRVLDSLPPRQRVVVCMKFMEGKSQREIASALSISEACVSKLLLRARRRIEAMKEADHVPMG
jgi:RNA polymerase sigma factor (sigma-70 family)